ncbi:hypothetical protein PVAND_011587 [Polypedilum vanderplanki]|uniref:Chitin-binding type-2 domain-containing protein n=1 Tax=Polypedilum vanderplanki TaxID=319348 RepID=A0A9J6CJS9_POLVA|nr:hypothetical protein PVAND_011587 [Polypedilum vanderplanki]
MMKGAVIFLSVIIYCAANVCEDELLLIGRNPDNCQNHFMCMLGSRVDFWCPDGEIYDEARFSCRPGNTESCEFSVTPVPENACENEFFVISPHPDRFECQRFFVCLNYNLIQFECDPGFIFSTNGLTCVPGNLRSCR